ncbi:MAG: hypothetical protein WAL85_14775 [Candidatus Korobacteraceae bacterium]
MTARLGSATVGLRHQHLDCKARETLGFSEAPILGYIVEKQAVLRKTGLQVRWQKSPFGGLASHQR